MSKCAIVTGASQGLGLNLVKEGIKRGYRVYALDLKISDDLKALGSESCIVYDCDITDDQSVEMCKRKICKNCGSIDILFNNAGIWLDVKRMTLDDPEFDFDAVFKQFNVNAVGMLKMSRAFIKLILNSEVKCMINISSEAGSIGDCWRKGEYGYCMSKAAQNMACAIMKNAYPDITFYSIHPGWMVTPQGMAGADENSKPTQNPADTAEILYDMAERKTSKYTYCDFNANKLNY